VVLTTGMAFCVTLAALIPRTAGIASALVVGGMLQSAAMLTRNLSLREALPPRAHAAGYSVMYAAAGAGYAATGSLAGALLRVVTPSTAVLAGVGVTLVLSAIGWWGETRRAGRSAEAVGDAAAPGFAGAGPEGPAVGGRGDAERCL
jgi:hypothetical protein